MNGFDSAATAMSLAKQLLTQCEGPGDITLSKETLKLVLCGYVQSWHAEQDKRRAEIKKVAN